MRRLIALRSRCQCKIPSQIKRALGEGELGDADVYKRFCIACDRLRWEGNDSCILKAISWHISISRSNHLELHLSIAYTPTYKKQDLSHLVEGKRPLGLHLVTFGDSKIDLRTE